MLKIKLPHFKKYLILLLLAIIFCIVAVLLIKKAIYESSYFNIKNIVIEGTSGIESHRDLLGKNLFSVDLKRIEKRLLFEYPRLRNIEVIRSLPDTLIINIEKRLPVAKLKLNLPSIGKERLYFIDNEATVLDLPYDKKYKSLPEVLGLKNKIRNPEVGKRIKEDDLDVALAILREYKKTEDFRQYAIESLDVSDLSETSFEIRQDFANTPHKKRNKNIARGMPRITRGMLRIKIIIGKDKISQRLEMLSSLLSKIKSNLKDIRYIDLRFEDPVAGSYGEK